MVANYFNSDVIEIIQKFMYLIIEFVPALDCNTNGLAIQNAAVRVAREPSQAAPLKMRVYYTCNEGYTLYGTTFRICIYIPGDKNRWAGESPVCRRKSLCQNMSLCQ